MFISILKKVSPSLVHFFMHRLQLKPCNHPVSHLGEVAGKVSSTHLGASPSRPILFKNQKGDKKCVN